MKKIRGKIKKIGEQLIKDCPRYIQYEDLKCDPKKGIIPRGLIYEEKNRHSDHGSVIVGLNPGSAAKEEKDFFRKHFKSSSLTYKKFLEYWEENILNHSYYNKLRCVVNNLGLTGPILWTELVKCQSTVKRKIKVPLQVQTIRDDINRYLFKEINLVPINWPLIGVGTQAFEILSYVFPKRIIFGVPHATGSYGQFASLVKKEKRKNKEIVVLKPEIRSKARKIIKLGKPIAIRF